MFLIIGIVAQAEQARWFEGGRITLTIVSLILNIVMVGLVAYTMMHAKTTEVLKGEKEAWREKAERLEKENKSLSTENAALHARTDITDIRARAISSEDEHKKIVAAIEENTRMLKGFMSQMGAVFDTQLENFRAISEGLRNLNSK